MIAQVTPGSRDVLTAAALEAELIARGCQKTGATTNRTCIWRAPNGRSFSAPDPAHVYLVPTRSLRKIHEILEKLAKLQPPPGLKKNSH